MAADMCEPPSGMSDTCVAPSGDRLTYFGLAPSTLAFIIVPALAMAPLLTLIVVPWVVSKVCRVMGWYLRRKTEGRRAHLVELMEDDDAKYGDGEDQDGWESIDAQGLGSAKNGGKAEREWDGIVGFFHPFWSVPPCISLGTRVHGS